MELVLEIFGWLIRALFSGIVFAGALHYMEGKRILRGTVPVLFCGAAGCLPIWFPTGFCTGWRAFPGRGQPAFLQGLPWRR